MYLVLAAAAAGITPTSSIRIGHLIGRNRHGIDAANQFSSLGLLIGGEESVLRRLGSLELQTLVLSRQSSNLVLSQKVEDRTAVGVLVVDDVPSAILDGIPGIASLGSHVVANALDCCLGSSALGGQVIIHAVHCPLGLAAAVLKLIAQIADSIIHTMEAVGYGGEDTALAGLETVQRKALVDVGSSSPALTGGRAQAISGVTTPAAAIAAPTEHTEDQEQNNPGGPIASPAAKTAIPALIGRLHGHGHYSAVRRKTHCVISFFDLFSKPGRDFD